MSSAGPQVLIETIRDQLDASADAIMTAAESGLRSLAATRSGEPAAVDALELSLTRILEACAFQDLAGQRLSRLSALIRDPDTKVDPLLAGPQTPGQGLSQDAADALMTGDGRGWPG